MHDARIDREDVPLVMPRVSVVDDTRSGIYVKCQDRYSAHSRLRWITLRPYDAPQLRRSREASMPERCGLWTGLLWQLQK